MFKTKTIFLFISLIVISTFYGCAKPVETEHEAAYYKGVGDEYFAEKKYRNAISAYESALMRAESPDTAALIQLSLANSYFLAKQYVDAIPVYEVYLDYYGNTREAELATLRIGMAHFNLMRRPSQDQTQTLMALSYFNQITSRNPELAKEHDVDIKITEIHRRLAEKEYIIARYYGRILKHRPSMLRYKYLVDNYPQSPRVEISCYRLIKLLLRFDNITEAENYFTLLQSKFPSSKYINDIQDAFAKKANENMKKEEDSINNFEENKEQENK